jgi:CheY-like chemotaxis protein
MSVRVLVIEDNPASLELMSYLLKAFGHTVLPALDGVEGVAIARRSKPDVIVCDVELPRLDGYGVVRELKADPDSKSIPVVAVTAMAMLGDREKLLAAGFDGYLPKPIDPRTFVQQIEVFVSSPLRSTTCE